MLVVASSATAGRIVPSGGLLGISGVESGKAAPFVGGPPGVELHTVVDGLPSGVIGEMVPVVLPTVRVGMVPSAAEADDVGPVGLPIGDTAGIPCAICPVGVEQVTTVPGVVGSEANGTGAKVVSGTAGWVAAENGLGPFRGMRRSPPASMEGRWLWYPWWRPAPG